MRSTNIVTQIAILFPLFPRNSKDSMIVTVGDVERIILVESQSVRLIEHTEDLSMLPILAVGHFSLGGPWRPAHNSMVVDVGHENVTVRCDRNILWVVEGPQVVAALSAGDDRALI
jgi:hypothetical protein